MFVSPEDKSWPNTIEDYPVFEFLAKVIFQKDLHYHEKMDTLISDDIDIAMLHGITLEEGQEATQANLDITVVGNMRCLTEGKHCVYSPELDR